MGLRTVCVACLCLLAMNAQARGQATRKQFIHLNFDAQPAGEKEDAEPFGDLCEELQKEWPKNRMVRIVFHGHSVPAGYFKTPEVQRLNSYPAILHQTLSERFSTAVIDCSVTAIGGENSASGAKRFSRDVLSLRPDVVFIDYALNDRRLGLEKSGRAWRSMIEAALKQKCKIVLLTPTPDSREDILDLSSPLEAHTKQILELGKEYRVPVIDAYRAFRELVANGNPVTKYLSQINHPNREGHELVSGLLSQLFPKGVAPKAGKVESASERPQTSKLERASSQRRYISAAVPAKLQIINGSQQDVEVFWINEAGNRVSNGLVQAGRDRVISTTVGHQFVVVGKKDGSQINVQSSVRIQALRFDPPDPLGIPSFYTQRTDAKGLPIVASKNVNPYALQEAKYLINLMLANREDVRRAMIQSGSRLCILAHNEFTTDQPEFVWLGRQRMAKFKTVTAKDYWDARARGMGGSERDPFCSCAEENLLAYSGDPYSTECILIHELAHNIHLRGLNNVDASFDSRLRSAYDSAMVAGLWKGKYASVNHHEYFAEGVQSWFDNNRENDHDHNHVNTREELQAYDPRLASLCEEVFGDTKLRYTKPTTRISGHMTGYSAKDAPKFIWPERLKAAKRAILEDARNRGK